MSETWRKRVFLLQCILLIATGVLVFFQYRTLMRLQAAERAAAAPGGLKPISMERVFNFPEVTCAPKPVPVFTEDKKQAAAAAVPQSLTILARQQFQYGLLVSGCLLGGLLMGVAISHRAASRETRLAALKSNFVSNISHEMKTPLAKIQMFAETLEAGRVRDPQKVVEYTRVIHKESRRLGQMVEDVLDFARMEAGTLRYRLAPCDTGGMLDRIAAEFESTVEMAGGTFRATLADDLPVILADEKALGQVVQNLLDNALKYSPDERFITLTAGWQPGTIRIEVADRGVGIPEPDRQRIFDKFYRVEGGSVHNTKGAGLGLAIAQHIVQAHGGKIEVASRVGEGSRFTVTIPAARIEHGQHAETVDHRG